MQSVYKYSIIKNLNLILQFHQNEITVEGLKKLKQDIYNDKDYNPDFFVLMDIRFATIKMNQEELIQLMNWINENSKSSGKYPTIIITDSPEQVAKSMMYRVNDKIKKFQIRIFSTLEKSLITMGIDFSNLESIETELKKMKVSY
jgi:hypothetical protein